MISTTVHSIEYTGNGSTDTFPYGWRVLDQAHLLVRKITNADATVATLVLGTDYAVTGVKRAAGGSVVLAAGVLASGYTLRIERLLPLLQETDLRNQGSFYPETLEDALDYLVMLAQQLADPAAPPVYTTASRPTASDVWVGKKIRVKDADQPENVQRCLRSAAGVPDWVIVEAGPAS